MSVATGTGSYGEPFQHATPLRTCGLPVSHGRIASRSFSLSVPSTPARRSSTAVPLAGSRASAERSRVTCMIVRLRTRGRPTSSRISPRGAGETTCRLELASAAAA